MGPSKRRRMIKRLVIVLNTAIWLCVGVRAQTFTAGGIVGAEYDYKILKG